MTRLTGYKTRVLILFTAFITRHFISAAVILLASLGLLKQGMPEE
jgi:hypothetical protein